jgi:hypothetical protein
MTDSNFQRDSRTTRLIVPNESTERAAPGLYDASRLSRSEPGLYAFIPVHTTKAGEND